MAALEKLNQISKQAQEVAAPTKFLGKTGLPIPKHIGEATPDQIQKESAYYVY